MPWYDIAFFALLGGVIGFGVYRVARPKMSDEVRANYAESRARRREALALTFSPGERLWMIASFAVMGGLLLWSLA